MSARDAILARIRRSLGVSGADPARRQAVAERLEQRPRGVIPARGQLPDEARVRFFVEMARRSHAVVELLPAAEVPRALADFLERQGSPRVVRMGDDPRLSALPWGDAGIEVLHGTAAPDDAVGVSHAEAGIAETGTAVLVSGAANPTLLAFLPPVHVIVLRATDIVGDPETAMEKVSARLGPDAAPRCITMITGPSRSADVEQTLCLGAHGPRQVVVFVV